MFMRRYFEQFESAVGIDMSGSDSARLVNHLKSVQPELAEVDEEDITKLDKSFTWEMWDAVALVFVLMASGTGLDVPVVSGVVNGLKYC